MSLEKIFLHIGSPKTGTSIIQSHLQQNRRTLRDKGYFYPATLSPYPHVYRTFESHHLLTYAIAGWKPFDLFSPQRFMERARRACETHGMHTMLLSAENTYWLPTLTVREKDFDPARYWNEKEAFIRGVRDCLGEHDVKIIVYFRRQDHWLESWYNQQIKNGNPVDENFHQFAAQHDVYLDYQRNVNLWAAVFGAGNIIVRPYEREQLPGGLLGDFLGHLGLGDVDEYPLHKPGRHNAKLDRDTMEFMKILNRIEMDADDRNWLKIAVRRVTDQFTRQEVFRSLWLFPPDVRAELNARYEAGNDELARQYLGRKTGGLFVEKDPGGSAETWKPYPGLPMDFAVSTFMKLLLEVRASNHADAGKAAQPAGPVSSWSEAELLNEEQRLWDETIWGE